MVKLLKSVKILEQKYVHCGMQTDILEMIHLLIMNVLFLEIIIMVDYYWFLVF